MEFYHFDRLKTLKRGQTIVLKDYRYLPLNDLNCKKILENLDYKLSAHGENMLLRLFPEGYNLTDQYIDLILELIRQAYFPQKQSRLQSVFAFKNLTDYKSFETFAKLKLGEFSIAVLECDACSVHDAAWLTGFAKFANNSGEAFSNVTLLDNMFHYWNGDISRNPSIECLLPTDITVKEIVSPNILLA